VLYVHIKSNSDDEPSQELVFGDPVHVSPWELQSPVYGEVIGKYFIFIFSEKYIFREIYTFLRETYRSFIKRDKKVFN